MEMNDYLLNLVQCNKLIHEDIINNDSFSEKDLEQINIKMGELMKQLAFWAEINNEDRFGYELKNHIKWLLENYS